MWTQKKDIAQGWLGMIAHKLKGVTWVSVNMAPPVLQPRPSRAMSHPPQGIYVIQNGFCCLALQSQSNYKYMTPVQDAELATEFVHLHAKEEFQ